MNEERVWMIRAGSKGEAERTCLELGLCGVGWPRMPSLAGMTPAELAEEIDLVYAGEPEGRIRSYHRQLRDFMLIQPGDLVVLPLKSDRRKVAIGEIAGTYEYRPELGDLLNHARTVDWLTTAFPRQGFERVMGSLNQPTTVGRLPLTATELISAVEREHPL